MAVDGDHDNKTNDLPNSKSTSLTEHIPMPMPMPSSSSSVSSTSLASYSGTSIGSDNHPPQPLDSSPNCSSSNKNISPPKTGIFSKRFICSFCAKAFSRSEHKIRHERSHTGFKPYKCLLCDHSFVRSDLTIRHLKTVHKDQINLLQKDNLKNEDPSEFSQTSIETIIRSLIKIDHSDKNSNSNIKHISDKNLKIKTNSEINNNNNNNNNTKRRKNKKRKNKQKDIHNILVRSPSPTSSSLSSLQQQKHDHQSVPPFSSSSSSLIPSISLIYHNKKYPNGNQIGKEKDHQDIKIKHEIDESVYLYLISKYNKEVFPYDLKQINHLTQLSLNHLLNTDHSKSLLLKNIKKDVMEINSPSLLLSLLSLGKLESSPLEKSRNDSEKLWLLSLNEAKELVPNSNENIEIIIITYSILSHILLCSYSSLSPTSKSSSKIYSLDNIINFLDLHFQNILNIIIDNNASTNDNLLRYLCDNNDTGEETFWNIFNLWVSLIKITNSFNDTSLKIYKWFTNQTLIDKNDTTGNNYKENNEDIKLIELLITNKSTSYIEFNGKFILNSLANSLYCESILMTSLPNTYNGNFQSLREYHNSLINANKKVSMFANSILRTNNIHHNQPSKNHDPHVFSTIQNLKNWKYNILLPNCPDKFIPLLSEYLIPILSNEHWLLWEVTWLDFLRILRSPVLISRNGVLEDPSSSIAKIKTKNNVSLQNHTLLSTPTMKKPSIQYPRLNQSWYIDDFLNIIHPTDSSLILNNLGICVIPILINLLTITTTSTATNEQQLEDNELIINEKFIRLIVDIIIFQLKICSCDLIVPFPNASNHTLGYLKNPIIQMLFFVWYSIIMNHTKNNNKDNKESEDHEFQCISFFINHYIKNPNKRINIDVLFEKDLSIILFDLNSMEFKGYHYLLKFISTYFIEEIIKKKLLISPYLDDLTKSKLMEMSSRTLHALDLKLKHTTRPHTRIHSQQISFNNASTDNPNFVPNTIISINNARTTTSRPSSNNIPLNEHKNKITTITADQHKPLNKIPSISTTIEPTATATATATTNGKRKCSIAEIINDNNSYDIDTEVNQQNDNKRLNFQQLPSIQQSNYTYANCNTSPIRITNNYYSNQRLPFILNPRRYSSLDMSPKKNPTPYSANSSSRDGIVTTNGSATMDNPTIDNSNNDTINNGI
ncbi:uncharacterized protein NDAI_0D04240 [Naumovozyma dairenensis CBS 421]|uniref:C2H2-type domain-containing protein n=1 Tax=Naumovozyma dairenensis (strain ATCC 10597 / BCRC 20456 / CBS 421 / NBRC 0211 / NRRL Y-12639) TaxID=1071378 RepID=G0WAC7_NAUDC|nr:hypothetical protein NDAI_0D04240 [Naumovozyma dairenensis CBS 421]CCD24738.1 hypothetical protein NDAI_0D04240 [Naumovozyma dairenensis CBS 421]